MANKKPTEPKERAAVGRERKLALALVAMRDAISDHEPSFNMSEGLIKADNEAASLLKELGHADLESISARVTRLNAMLKSATEAGDWDEVARLGGELSRAQKGLPPTKPKGEKGKAAGGEV